MYKIETDSQTHRTGLWLPRVRGAGGGKDWKLGTSRCKPVYKMDNKVLPYSTGNYIQYSVVNHNGKTYDKEYIGIPESSCYTAEIAQCC